MELSIKVFPAANGDCFLIKIKDNENSKNILIDGGKGVLCHRELKVEFKNLKETNQYIDLLVLTHIDDDHIRGILELYQDKEINVSIIKKVWFNSGTLISTLISGHEEIDRELSLKPFSRKMSVRQGLTFEKLLGNSDSWYQDLIFVGQQHYLDDINLKILSPDLDTLKTLNNKWDSEISKMLAKKNNNRKMSSNTDYQKSIEELSDRKFEEDNSLFNKSSIAFILEYKDNKILMLGDSHPSVIVSSLRNLGYSENNKLKVDIMKISHHASKKNTSNELLNLLDCTQFIISTDGSKHGLPNKESLSRIVKLMKKPLTFYFNYNLMNKIFSAQECKDNKLTCIYLNNKHNYTVRD